MFMLLIVSGPLVFWMLALLVPPTFSWVDQLVGTVALLFAGYLMFWGFNRRCPYCRWDLSRHPTDSSVYYIIDVPHECPNCRSNLDEPYSEARAEKISIK